MKTVSQYVLGDIIVRYVTDETGKIGMIAVPAEMINEVKTEKDCHVDSLIQVKLIGDGYPGMFGNGVTMHNSETVDKLNYVGQEKHVTDDGCEICTCFSDNRIEAIHKLRWYEGKSGLSSEVIIQNSSNEKIGLEMLTSVSLGMLSPFDTGLATGNLKVHRLRSRWQHEAQLVTDSIEDLCLVPQQAHDIAYSERFGQRGNKPNNVFAPFCAVEDTSRNVLWGIQLTHSSSWQIELFRWDKGLTLCGGLADYDFGHWMKYMEPGEIFEAPKVYFTVCRGDLDLLCYRLTSMQKRAEKDIPEPEKDIPVVYNEWCTTWGCPTQESIYKAIEILKDRPVKYFIIDAGWYKKPEENWRETTGDWNINYDLYPDGFGNVIKAIKNAGMIPGLWYEPETCGKYSEAFIKDQHMLKRFGKSIVSLDRKFWDFTDPWVIDYMREKITNLLRKYGIQYWKVDSNECIGIGFDGFESMGEALRKNEEAFENFILETKNEIPGLIVENSSSGGQRMVPRMMELCDMVAFSDSFENIEAPIMAANAHRIALPEQIQIWCALRDNSSIKRLIYVLSTGFLGRMCLTGDLHALSSEQLKVMDEALALYEDAKETIRNGFTKRIGPKVVNYHEPTGWQVITRRCTINGDVMVVVHTFEDAPNKLVIDIPFEGEYTVKWELKRHGIICCAEASSLTVRGLEDLDGIVVMLTPVK